MNTKNHYAKIETELAGNRYVGTINLKDIPARCVQLTAFPRERGYIVTNKIIAVDFDGTLFENAYPKIGKPIFPVIDFVLRLKAAGNKIILWTCRCDSYLDVAVAACNEFGIVFDAVNDNLQESVNLYNNNSRKINADYYIDDKSFDFASLVCVDLPKGGSNE